LTPVIHLVSKKAFATFAAFCSKELPGGRLINPAETLNGWTATLFRELVSQSIRQQGAPDDFDFWLAPGATIQKMR
jgi:hypothetical protein